jgi:hypothetical protein
MDEHAEKLVEAAMNGDARAIKEIADAFDDEEDADEQEGINDRSHASKPRGITVPQRENETVEQAVAREVLQPTTLAATAAFELLYTGNVLPEYLAMPALIEALREQTRAVNDRNPDRGTEMLAAQAHTLDAMFNVLTRLALGQSRSDRRDAYFKTALRAQSQCRATWETISAIQNPPIAGYLNQTNIANNQQVNNGAAPSPAQEIQIPPSKLLEQTTHEPDQWLDRGAPAAAERRDSALEAVGTLDGVAHGSGQS